MVFVGNVAAVAVLLPRHPQCPMMAKERGTHTLQSSPQCLLIFSLTLFSPCGCFVGPVSVVECLTELTCDSACVSIFLFPNVIHSFKALLPLPPFPCICLSVHEYLIPRLLLATYSCHSPPSANQSHFFGRRFLSGV